jgi:hypothetical protein
MKLHPSVQKLLDDTQDLPREERLDRLHGALKEAIAVRKLNVMESISFSFGSGSTQQFNVEHPQYDSGNYPWTAVSSITGFMGTSKGYSLLDSDLSLQNARNACRRLAAENEFALGAHRLRRSYIMGTGVKWRVAPKDIEKENEKLTEKANESIQDFIDHNKWDLMEREIVHRVDRDGECFLRTFVNANGPLTVRFIEPELIRTPTSGKDPFGIKMGAKNGHEIVGYWLHKHEADDKPVLLRAEQPMGPEIPQVIHIKGNTDMDQKRGWPIMWPCRKNLDRAEKLLRNMSVVATLQAAIAVVRKHESATKADVSSFLQDNEDFNWTDPVSGTRQSAKAVGGDMGLVLDEGPGFSYDTPISSVNASVNVEVLRAELRSCAAMLNMPESMFTSQLDGSFASSLVGEAPFVKYMEGEQLFFGCHLKPVIQAHIDHEVWWNRLSAKVNKAYRLKGEFTSLEVRDFLKETQQRAIQADKGVMSIETWRAKEGLDQAIEERNIQREHEKKMERQEEMLAMKGPMPGQPTSAPDPEKDKAMVPGDGSNGGKGGKDQKAEKDPAAAKDNNFAQKDAQHLAEALMRGEGRSAIEIMKAHAPSLLGSGRRATYVIEMLDALTNRYVDDPHKIAKAIDLTVEFAPALKPLLTAEMASDEMSAIFAIQRNFGHLLGKDADTKMAMAIIGTLADERLMTRDKVAAVIGIIARPSQQSVTGDAGGEVFPGGPI